MKIKVISIDGKKTINEKHEARLKKAEAKKGKK